MGACGAQERACRRARANIPPTPCVRMWEVVRDLSGRKIPEIEKPVILEVAVVFVVFVGVILESKPN